jgi:hypothetical protein
MFGNVEGIALMSCGRRGCLGVLLLVVRLLHMLERPVPVLPIVVTAFSLRHMCEASFSWCVRPRYLPGVWVGMAQLSWGLIPCFMVLARFSAN